MQEEGSAPTKTRDFVCACGKNYLSYAALFTHIKQKHQGKAPGPIVRPRAQRKRGRPRKTPLLGSENKYSDSDFVNNSNGFQIPNQINNSYQYSEKKTKQAAEILLGSGGFQAFQAYRPQGAFTDSKKSLLKRVVSHGELSKKLELKNQSEDQEIPQDDEQLTLKFKASKSAPSMTIFSDKFQRPELKQYVNSHNQTLSHYFTEKDIQIDADLLKARIKAECTSLGSINNLATHTHPHLQPQSLQSSMHCYLNYVFDIVQQPHYLLIKYILGLFLGMLLKKQQFKDEISIDSSLKYSEQFMSTIQPSYFDFILNWPSSTVDNLQSKSDSKSTCAIYTDLVMDIFMMYTYWISILPNSYHLQHNNMLKNQPTQNNRLQSSFNKVSQTRKTLRKQQPYSHPNNKRKSNQGRPMNKIQDILEENISDYQPEQNSQDQKSDRSLYSPEFGTQRV